MITSGSKHYNHILIDEMGTCTLENQIIIDKYNFSKIYAHAGQFDILNFSLLLS